MKKFFVVFIIFCIFGCFCNKAESYMEMDNLMDFKEFKGITPDNIKSLTIRQYTEAGIVENKIEDKEKIGEIYNFLKPLKIIGETKYSCTDNTTIYYFKLNDDTEKYIEIECNWLVLNKKHYMLYNPTKGPKIYW